MTQSSIYDSTTEYQSAIDSDAEDIFVFPASFAQQRLWFLDQLEPGSSTYNMPSAVRLTGELNREALEQSFSEIIRRHESLRTTFATVDGQPVQVISEPRPVIIPVEDFSELDEAERQAQARSFVTQQAQTPFNLAQGPLIRISLVRLGELDHVLVVVMHHIISDGWSIGVLIRELTALYEANCAGQPSPLEELALQYADYAMWQRGYLQGSVLEEELGYWRKQLEGAPAVLELPTDRPRPAMQTFRGSVRSVAFSEEMTRGLGEMSRREGVTQFMLLMGGFQGLLMRYSGQEEIVVGTPVAGRSRVETEGMIGFFVNTLVLRADLSGNPTFSELLGRIREVCLGAYGHQEVPFERLVEELKPERSLSHSPIFQVMFGLQNTPQETAELPGLKMSPLGTGEDRTEPFDLELFMVEGANGLAGTLHYSTDLFDATTIERMLGHYERLLEGIVRDSEQAVSAINILSEAERKQVLEEWNDTAGGGTSTLCIHHLFEAQALLTPLAPALIFNHLSLSYSVLNLQANNLAHLLIRLGAVPESLVGICLDRSFDMVVALLAVLKAGAAYLPLDPRYPKDRLAWTISDADMLLLISQQSLLSSLPHHNARLICLDTDQQDLALESDDNPSTAVTADNLAYVIYTSGSTGRPKGVAIEHRNTVAMLEWAAEVYSKQQMRGVLASTSICFDLSVFEIFAPLAVGGSVILAENALELKELEAASEVTLINTVPSAIVELMREGAIGESMKTVNLAGEALSRRVVDDLYEGGRIERVYDLYGPTEDTTYTTWKLREAGGRATIGRGIRGEQIYILDKEKEAVPIGVVGEIYISGRGVTRGYMGRAEATAERYVPNPMGVVGGGRMYRTGDIGRWMREGEIEYIGRRDKQVKVRGYRIELGEIEEALRRHNDVKEAVVEVREDERGEKRLVGYVVGEAERGVTARELQEHLRERLPGYMMVSQIVMVEQMPMTANGKVDRKALPEPDQSRPEMEQGYVGPRTASEEILAGIWGEVLRVERVGVKDNFFELGGHSLLATQVMSRVREGFGVEVGLRKIFELPTVEGLAQCIDEAVGSGTSVELPQMKQVSREQHLPLSFSQERLWFLGQLEPDSWAYNMPVAMRLRGRIDITALEQVFSTVTSRHEVLRTTFPEVDGRPVQSISPAKPLSLLMTDLGELSEEEREAEAQRLVKEEAQRPFDLAQGPLFRIALVRLAEDDYVLLVTLHHIICDGWSMDVFTREVATLYEAYSTGQPSPLKDLPIQYADFAIWQRGWLQGDVLESQLDYWKQQLGGTITPLELPTNRIRPALLTHRGAEQPGMLSADVSRELKALSRREGATLFMTLLAGFKTLLYRYTGQRDILVGSPIAGRNRAEIEGLIGFFLNTLVLRTDLGDDPTFSELLYRVKEVALGAYSHQDVPFERLLEELQPERDLSRSPVFQVMFNLLSFNPTEKQTGLSKVSIAQLPQVGAESKFDVTLYAIEHDGQIQLRFIYNADLFDARMMSRMMDHLQVLFSNVVADPHRRISQLQLISETEQTALLSKGNLIAPSNDYIVFKRGEIDQTITSRFQHQVYQYGQKPAVKTKSGEWSYEELNRIANNVAHKLLAVCGRGEGRIALLFEHDGPMIAAMLGALKAGKTYVPLDPAYPEDWLEYVLSDVQAEAVVTNNLTEELGRRLARDRVQVINVESLELEPAEEDGQLDRQVSIHSIAYILYTSGSTGQPKGVMQSHRNVLQHIRNYTNNLHISSADRLTLLSTYAFDAAVMDIFGALLNGATLYPIKIKEEGVEELSRWISREEITIYHSTPTLYRYFINGLGQGAEFPHMRLIVLGGEEAQSKDVESFKKRFSGECLLVNGLGPTESTVSLQYFMDKQTEVTSNSVPVGYPVEDTEVLLLNDAGEQVALYGIGEIAIKSEQVALGYWQREEQTRASFIEDATGGERRIYRTGDLGRWLADGSIEFIGRKDHQVKIRGYRIETAEIETVLSSHNGVKEAVVEVREDERGEKRLVGYVVREAERGVTARELQEHLRERLPGYMMVSQIVMLEQMPMTANGKVDRKALPEPDQSRPEMEQGYVGPRTASEEILAGIWAEVLRVERVGVKDNFFELGGHSLLATQVMSRVREGFGVEVGLRKIFELPTVVGLAQCIDEAIRGGKKLQAPTIEAVRRDGQIELSFAQQRLWFLDQLEPGSSTYNMPSAVRLSGELNREALEQSFSEIIRRHESLRTTFATVDGQPVQVISEPRPVIIPVEDFSELDEQGRQAQARSFVTQQTQTPFNLAQGPLIRINLVRLAALDHVLVVVMHHIISDGWSIGVLIRELTALYEANCAGEASPLEELALQYADYAMWQREYLQGSVLEEELGYWRKQLEGAPAVLELPTDRLRPAVQTFRGSRRAISLTEELTRGVREVSRREGVTLFMALMGVFQALLMKYTGQQDIVVGTPIAGRNRVETEGMIGLFVNMLVMRTEVIGRESGRELMRRVKEVAIGAYAHQEVPFEKLVEELKPERSLSHSPIFQVMMVLQNTPRETVELAGLRMSGMNGEAGEGQRVKFDLTLTMLEMGERIVAVMGYNSELFEGATIERMLGHYESLLKGMVREPEQAVREIEILSEAERKQVLEEWNATAREYPTEQCIHELFEQRVEHSPDAIAVKYEEEEVTYGELNKRANQLAHYLRSRGVGVEQVVGISVERSIEMVVGMLGIIKAGGAYLPIDPSYPGERISYLLEDAGVEVLVTQRGVKERLPGHKAEEVCIDECEDIGKESEENPVKEVTTENLAYVIYTSGSTGQPKGVLVGHKGINNLVKAQIEAFGISETSRLLQFASFSFDASVSEIFTVLIAGGRLVISKAERLMPGLELMRLLKEEAITTVTLPPSVLTVMEAEGVEVSTVISAGEALPTEVAKRWARAGRLINAYGPSETTVCATMGECVEGIEKVTIGKAISNVEMYILDEEMRPVGIGIPGEIYIGGAGVGRGYKGRAELTAESFVPHPYSHRVGERLYRTGDTGRYLITGEIEFVGRKDNQVKVRGYRIELGEIESALMVHEAVREAVVIARGEAGGEKRLVGYVVGKQDEEVNTSELRRHLSEQLPEYMIPSIFVFVDRIPLTVNGKIDRRALPEPDRTRPELDRQYQAPSTELQRVLVEMWEQSLGIEPIGINDNFFELGGDSIRSAIFINRLQEVLGEYVYVVAIFDAPTVAQLSEYLTANYQQAVNRMCGVAVIVEGLKEEGQVDESKVEQIRGMIKPLARRTHQSKEKNRPAVFILSAPRSGSTLLRVMLAGHSRLFAPPELELLRFNTLRERQEAFEGRNSFWLEGTLRAMMEAKGISLDEARQEMSRYEEEGMSVKEFYAEMQGWIGERMLVDKSPSYALNEEAMRRGEEDFEGARYIHLVRHPMGMINSFEEAKLEQVFFQYEHEYGRRELAELIWVVSNENIGRFLEGVEEGRKHKVIYEEMVKEPRKQIERMCEKLGIEMEEEMLEPYREKRMRMTDGVHEESKMLGDVKFHEHRGIEREVAERWKQKVKEREKLWEGTWKIAEGYGYERQEQNEESGRKEYPKPIKRAAIEKGSALVDFRTGGSGQPFFCVHAAGGGVSGLVDLAGYLGSAHQFYGFQAKGLDEGQIPYARIEEMAAHYVEEMQALQPEGSYLLGGWSLGGVVAYEMARQLRGRGEKVALLALLDSKAPFYSDQDDGEDDLTLLTYFALDLGISLSEFNDQLKQARQLDPDKQMAYLLERATNAGLLPSSVSLSQLGRLFNLFKNNVRAVRRYKPQPAPVRIILFRAAERLRDAARDTTSGWETLAADGVEVHEVPGNHYTMMREPHAKVLAECLRHCIEMTNRSNQS